MTSSSSARPGRLISLDDPAATRAELTGGKAAALARARQAGLPALAGYVAPIREGAAALRAGRAALREAGRPAALRAGRAALREAGRPAARRALLAAPADPDPAAV